MGYRDTNLWREALEPRDGDVYAVERARLASVLDQFRLKAEILAEEIARSVPYLTDHSVRHLDTLWETAGLIAGPDFRLSPTEALVYGGAVLLHDLGNAIAAYPGGIDDLKGPEWDDLMVDAFLTTTGAPPSLEEMEDPPEEIYYDVLLRRLRQVHASQAEVLATQGFFHHGDPSRRTYLMDDESLRESLGPTIGRIASSHHWEVDKLAVEFSVPMGTPTDLPSEWFIDPLTVACLLRTADAAHLDSRRAPTFTKALRRPTGGSGLHWEFQNRLLRPAVHDDQLVFTAKGAFPLEQRESWWLCYEALQNVNQELRRVDALMRRERKKRRFVAHSVSNIESPQSLTKHLPTSGWDPVDIRLRISDVLAVIDRFGGKKLYGDDAGVALRELLANSSDAIRARRILEDRDQKWGSIRVRLGRELSGWWLEVEDNGIGMSEEVLKGPLLDFGLSYWRSELARREHPGLLSSGFRPTGRFGIGFFAVFMLGDRVRVVTRPSSASADATQVLELMKATESRPYVRRSRGDEQDERVIEGGTRVRVWLSVDPSSSRGILADHPTAKEEEAKDLADPGVQKELLGHLAAVVAALAPALDVEVVCIVGGANEVVVRPNDWVTIPFEQLVSRLGGPSGSQQRWRKTRVQGDLQRDGEMVARIGLCPPTFSLTSPGVLTVGGLVAKRGIGTYDGIVVGRNPTLNRGDAEPVVGLMEITELVQSGMVALGNASLNWDESLHFAQLMLNVGLAPESLACFILDNHRVTLSEARRWLSDKDAGEAVFIVHVDGFEFTDSLGKEQQVDFDACSDRWDQPQSVIIVGESRSGELLRGLPSGPSRWAAINSQQAQGTLGRYLIKEAAAVWGVEEREVLENGSREEMHIGDLATDLGIAEIVVDCFVIHRPETPAPSQVGVQRTAEDDQDP